MFQKHFGYFLLKKQEDILAKIFLKGFAKVLANMLKQKHSFQNHCSSYFGTVGGPRYFSASLTSTAHRRREIDLRVSSIHRRNNLLLQRRHFRPDIVLVWIKMILRDLSALSLAAVSAHIGNKHRWALIRYFVTVSNDR
jgi:hypothetical protein